MQTKKAKRIDVSSSVPFFRQVSLSKRTRILKPGDIIGLDFDGVIADTETAKLRFARDELGLPVSRSQLNRVAFQELYGNRRGIELYQMIIDNIYKTRAMVDSVNPISGALEGIRELRTLGFECIVVTARQGTIDDQTSKYYWAQAFLDKHGLSSKIQGVVSANERPKSQIAKALNVRAFVDDDYLVLRQMVGLGIPLLLFTNAANSTLQSAEIRAVRVNDWEELLDNIKVLMCPEARL